MTALHWAVFNDDAPTVKALLAAGAEQTFDKNNNSPADIAGFCQLDMMVKLLTDKLLERLRPRYSQYHELHKLLEESVNNMNANIDTRKAMENISKNSIMQSPDVQL